MILILASKRDVHARGVASALEHAGQPVAIVDAGTLGNGATLSYAIGAEPTAVFANDERIEFGNATCVWGRRPRMGHVAEGIRDPNVRSFCRQEWSDLLQGLFLNSSARFVNPVLAEFAAVKPRQLHVARQVGLRIPDTLITSDPDCAGAFIERHRGQVIHKALTAPKQKLLDTKIWDESHRAALEALPLAPVMFQELIRGPADVRVTFVGNQLFAARIATELGASGVDSRLDMDAPYEQHQLPLDVHDLIVAFMSAMGLVYGTIDLKITPGGDYVFFEVNPQGQFLYVEILTGLPITAAMADFLSDSSTSRR
jgi:hypothetical protein